MKISNEDARELSACSPGDDVRNPTLSLGLPLDVVENRDYEEKRWEMVMELVVKDDDGKLWRTFYRRELTEMTGDGPPFGYDGDMIEFAEVERLAVTTYVYRKVGQ